MDSAAWGEFLKLNIVDNTTICCKTLAGGALARVFLEGATCLLRVWKATPLVMGIQTQCLPRVKKRSAIMGLKNFAIVLGAAGVFSCTLAGAQPGSHDLRGAKASAGTQSTGVDLIRANNCLACHQVSQKRVGPAFTLIAQRFAGQAGALEYLAGAIRQGGKGRWGPVPMPAQPQVSPEQASAIAAWILTLAAP